jgi:hypothetical protein
VLDDDAVVFGVLDDNVSGGRADGEWYGQECQRRREKQCAFHEFLRGKVLTKETTPVVETMTNMEITICSIRAGRIARYQFWSWPRPPAPSAFRTVSCWVCFAYAGPDAPF